MDQNRELTARAGTLPARMASSQGGRPSPDAQADDPADGLPIRTSLLMDLSENGENARRKASIM